MSISLIELKKQNMKFQIIGIATVIFFTIPAFASAQNVSDSAVRAQCFTTLKENMAETTIFSEPLKTIATTTYNDLESKFSKNYTGLSSFGIDIDRGDFEMRLYSFGRQTGYQHPPKSPFPVSTKSELWGENTKEYIIAEEYIVDDSKQKHFLNCAFFKISGEDLMQVTRERYLYDGAMVSITKTPENKEYKAWYSENLSFDHLDKPFVAWKRLFVYPKATQNTYFNRYDIQDAYPAHKVDSFKILNFKNSKEAKIIIAQVRDIDANGNTITKTFSVNDKGAPFEVLPPDELKPIISEGINNNFPLTTYYQAIQSIFPEFSKKLSIRGTLQYDTFKKLLISDSLDSESQKILNNLRDPRALTRYNLNKERITSAGAKYSNPKLDDVFEQIKDADKSLKDIQEKIEKKKYYFSINEWKMIAGNTLILALIVLVIVYITRKKNKPVILSITGKNIMSTGDNTIIGEKLNTTKEVFIIDNNGIKTDLEYTIINDNDITIKIPDSVIVKDILHLCVVNSSGESLPCELSLLKVDGNLIKNNSTDILPINK